MSAGRTVLAIVLALAAPQLAPRAVHAQQAHDDVSARVTCLLWNGDRIGGALRHASSRTIHLHDDVLGDVRVPRDGVAHCESESDAVRAQLGGLALAPFDLQRAVAITPRREASLAPRLALVTTRTASLERLKHVRAA